MTSPALEHGLYSLRGKHTSERFRLDRCCIAARRGDGRGDGDHRSERRWIQGQGEGRGTRRLLHGLRPHRRSTGGEVVAASVDRGDRMRAGHYCPVKLS